MADYQIVHLIDGRDLPHLRKPVVQALDLSRLKKDSMTASFENIGVVGSTELRVHDDVKHPEVVIQGAGKTRLKL